jgi:hypothetical protein
MHDLTGKSLYFAVRCYANHDHVIRLAVVDFDYDGSCSKTWQDVPPFEAYCGSCKTSQSFSGHQVEVWLGPLSTEDFRNHPAFQ